jgi:hypothetical protein
MLEPFIAAVALRFRQFLKNGLRASVAQGGKTWQLGQGLPHKRDKLKETLVLWRGCQSNDRGTLISTMNNKYARIRLMHSA